MIEMRSWLQDPGVTVDVANDLEGERRQANAYNEAYLKLYHNVPVAAIEGDRDAGIVRLRALEALAKRGYNLGREMCDASASQICKTTQAKLTPVGGDYEIFLNCRTLNRLIDGMTDHLDAITFMTRAYRDCQKCDVGVVYAGMDAKGELFLERWNPLWVLWPDDGTDNPQTIMYVDAVPRVNLMARYPKRAADIARLPQWERPRVIGVTKAYGSSKRSDTVKVVRAFARKIEDTPGQYTVACEAGLVLENKPWPYDRHPAVVFRWDYGHEGFAGVPLMEVLEPYHSRVKRNIRVIDQCLKGARPTIMADEDLLADAKFSDLPFQKIPIRAGSPPPTIVPLQTVPADLLQSVERDYLRAAAEAGVSQALAAGQGPTSITSGKGLREYVAIANQRLSVQQRIWERGWCDLARVIVMLCNSAYQNRTVRVAAPQSDWLEEVKWIGPDKLREDQYKVTYKPSTGMSSTLAGMYEDIDYLQKSGVPVTPAEVTRLVASNVPDVAALADRLNAPMDLAEKQIDQCLHGDENTPVPMPTALQGESLHTMLRMAKERYMQAMAKQNVPRQRLQRLRRLISMIESRLGPPPTAPQPMIQPIAPAPGPEQGMPPEQQPAEMAPPMAAPAVA